LKRNREKKEKTLAQSASKNLGPRGGSKVMGVKNVKELTMKFKKGRHQWENMGKYPCRGYEVGKEKKRKNAGVW